MDENVKEKTENENAGDFAAISVQNTANPEGWQPDLLEKGKAANGDKSGQPLSADAVREARGREIGLMADHGMYDIVARVRQACEGQVAR